MVLCSIRKSPSYNLPPTNFSKLYTILLIFHTPLDDDAYCEHSQGDIKSKAFINSEIGQLALNKEKQHVFNVLNVKPFEIAFFEFVELVIISTYSDLIQMLVVMPFDDLKLCDSDDSTFGTSLRKNSSSIRLLHDPFISSYVRPANNSGVRVSTLSRFNTNDEKSRGISTSSLNKAKSCFKHDQELEVLLASETSQDAELTSRLVMRFDPSVDLPVVLEVFSFGALVESGSFQARLLLDPRFNPAKGSSSLSSSSRRLFNVTVSLYVSTMSLSHSYFHSFIHPVVKVLINNTRIEEIAPANWFVCMNSEKLISRALSQWSNPNKDPKLENLAKRSLEHLLVRELVFVVELG
nr:hypothetical protein [Tanacetum cinerariifolium]